MAIATGMMLAPTNQAMALPSGLPDELTVTKMPIMRRAACTKQAMPPHFAARQALASVVDGAFVAMLIELLAGEAWQTNERVAS